MKLRATDRNGFRNYALSTMEEIGMLLGHIRTFNYFKQRRVLVHHEIADVIDKLDNVIHTSALRTSIYDYLEEIQGDISRRRLRELYTKIMDARSQFWEQVVLPLTELSSLRMLNLRRQEREFVEEMVKRANNINDYMHEALMHINYPE